MNGYLYILKHGIGPGTMPSDITILKEKDLPNYYTAVWLDRFLTTSELKQYDIPSETRINELLDRIDYCQADNGNDVVPCKDIKASTMSKPTVDSVLNLIDDNEIVFKNDVAYWNRGKGVLPKEYRDCIAQTEYAHWINEWSCEQAEKYGSRAYYDYDGETDVDACGSITASVWDDNKDKNIEYIASQVENELNITYRDDDNWIYIFDDEDGVNSPFSYADLNSYYTKLLKNRNYHRFKPVKKSIQQFEDKITKLSSSSNSAEEFKNNYRKYLMSLVDLHDVEACDKVTASKIVASKMSDIDLLINEALECTTKDELSGVISGLDSLGLRKLYLHYMEMLRDDSLSVGYIASDLSDTLYNMFSDGSNNINASTEPKYFANMVSADTYFRHPSEWGYEVRGYYDEDRRGLAESGWTEDIRMVNDLLNEYANDGYYLRVVNRYAGIILDIDADDWFDSFYPEGLSEGELE